MESNKTAPVKLDKITIGGNYPFVLIAGPCVIESAEHSLKIAGELKNITDKLDIPFIFKSSYDKANRSSINTYRGPGLEDGLKILYEIKKKFGLHVLSDVHSIEEVSPASEVLDIIQIPALLCRQTDLLIAAGNTKKIVNIKKGQFLAPDDMINVLRKIQSTGNEKILLTERGTTFGYNNLIVDMRSLPIMRSMGYPVVFDATHSVQLPGAAGSCSGGQREFIPPLCRAATAVGIDALFMEVHDCPDRGLCDGANMFELDKLKDLLICVKNIDNLVKKGI